jgi:hypothetical protein
VSLGHVSTYPDQLCDLPWPLRWKSRGNDITSLSIQKGGYRGPVIQMVRLTRFLYIIALPIDTRRGDMTDMTGMTDFLTLLQKISNSFILKYL